MVISACSALLIAIISFIIWMIKHKKASKKAPLKNEISPESEVESKDQATADDQPLPEDENHSNE